MSRPPKEAAASIRRSSRNSDYVAPKVVSAAEGAVEGAVSALDLITIGYELARIILHGALAHRAAACLPR